LRPFYSKYFGNSVGKRICPERKILLVVSFEGYGRRLGLLSLLE
jgi:hypothetical protein